MIRGIIHINLYSKKWVLNHMEDSLLRAAGEVSIKPFPPLLESAHRCLWDGGRRGFFIWVCSRIYLRSRAERGGVTLQNYGTCHRGRQRVHGGRRLYCSAFQFRPSFGWRIISGFNPSLPAVLPYKRLQVQAGVCPLHLYHLQALGIIRRLSDAEGENAPIF